MTRGRLSVAQRCRQPPGVSDSQSQGSIRNLNYRESLRAFTQVSTLRVIYIAGGQGWGRTTDRPLFRIKDHRLGLTVLVFLPAHPPPMVRERLRRTHVNETRNETARVRVAALGTLRRTRLPHSNLDNSIALAMAAQFASYQDRWRAVSSSSYKWAGDISADPCRGERNR